MQESIHLHAGASSDDNTFEASKSFLGQSFEIKPTGFLYLKILLILVLFVASIIKLIIKKIYLPFFKIDLIGKFRLNIFKLLLKTLNFLSQ